MARMSPKCADFLRFGVPDIGDKFDRRVEALTDPNFLKLGFRFLEEHDAWLAASAASRCTAKTRSRSLDLNTHLSSRLSTMNWTTAVIS
jgi:hypothetical protein